MNCYFPECKTEGVAVGLHAHAQGLATAGGRLQSCPWLSSERSSGLPGVTQPVIVTLEHRPRTPTSSCQAPGLHHPAVRAGRCKGRRHALLLGSAELHSIQTAESAGNSQDETNLFQDVHAHGTSRIKNGSPL